MKKICLKCKSDKTKKNWRRQGKQRYLCRSCWFVWEHWKWKNQQIKNFEDFFATYVSDDLKYRQMWQTLNLSRRTIQKILDTAPFKKIIVIQ